MTRSAIFATGFVRGPGAWAIGAMTKGVQSIRHLTELAAYEHWHRLLFTRFLTENHLLITDEENGSVPITLDECEELAPELGARDGFDLACRFASPHSAGRVPSR